jgi:hypothetical protein
MSPNRYQRALTILTVLLLCAPSLGFARKFKDISLTLYPGYTLINFEKALPWPNTNLNESSRFHFSLAARGFIESKKQFHFGAELALNQLYYAYYIIPSGQTPIYDEYTVSTGSLMALARLPLDDFFAVGGVGFQVFNNGISPAICLEAGYTFTATKKLKFPVSIRINPILGNGMPVPVSIGAGMSYRFW